jgi:hypothetical protein
MATIDIAMESTSQSILNALGNANTNAIKKIQNLTATASSSGTDNTISSVDTSKAIILVHAHSYDQKQGVSVKFTSSTNVHADTASGSFTFNMSVVEFY